jgi:hypothetical protein
LDLDFNLTINNNTLMKNSKRFDSIKGNWLPNRIDNTLLKSYLMGFEESLKNFYEKKRPSHGSSYYSK